MLEAIQTKITCRHHNNHLAGYFCIKNTRKLVAHKYYWSKLSYNLNAHIKGCDIYLALKRMSYKTYADLKSSLISTHCWKDLSISFMTGLPISTNWKRETSDSLLVIVNRLRKMAYYKPVKITINAL